MATLNPRVYGSPDYLDNLFDLDVYGDWLAEGGPGTLSDTTSISDAATRQFTGSRSATDTTSVSESVGRSAVRVRTATDTTAVSESVSPIVGIPRIRQYTTGQGGTLTLGSAPIQGDTLVVLRGSRGSRSAISGYTDGPDGQTLALNNDASRIAYKTAGASEPSTLSPGDETTWVELDQEVLVDGHAAAHDDGVHQAQASVSLAVGDKTIVFAIITEGTDGGWGNQTFTPPAGWVELMDLRDPTDHPSVWVGYQLVPVATTVTANPICTATGWWTAEIISFKAKATFRYATDTTSVSDAASRHVNYVRSPSDTVTGSENVGKERRLLVESIPTTDFLSGGKATGGRTLTDTLHTSDSLLSVFGHNIRTPTETLTTSDHVDRAAMTFHRVCVDNAPAHDSIGYAAQTPVASFTYDVVSGEEPLRVQFADTSTNYPTSWLWDFGDGTTSTEQNPYHIYAAGTYTVSLTVTNAAGSNTVTFTALVTATALSSPVGPNQPVPPVTVQIKVGGVDITDVVRYKDAEFNSAVNGSIGQILFAVRDTGHTYGFVEGDEIELRLDGQLYGFGYVKKITRQYTFPAEDTSDTEAITRWFLIEGWDVNVLLAARIAWNIAHPTKVMVPPAGLADSSAPDNWREGVTSKEVILYVLKNYTVLPSDGVTFNEVLDIGSPFDASGNIGAGITVDRFLQLVNSILNGIYYLRPNKSFVFRDVEVATTPFVLTDHPDGPYDIGPRDYSMTSDSTDMINDALVWGVANTPRVFARYESASSIAEHDRWQHGELAMLYKQTSVNHRANALVEGNSPTRHGAKEDALVCEATVFRPIFMLGDVVRCEMQTFDGSQTGPFNTSESYVAANLPVRRMRITFPTERNPEFKLGLTQELDIPWNTFEFPPFPRIGRPPPPPTIPPPGTLDQGNNHAYAGTLTFAVVTSTTYGSNFVGTNYGRGEAIAPQYPLNPLLLYSSTYAPYRLIHGVSYVGSMGMVVGAESAVEYGDYAPDMGFTSNLEGVLIRPIQVHGDGISVIGWAGTFNYYSGAQDVDVYAVASIARGGDKPFTAGGAPMHTASLSWWIDPIGAPPPITPVPGQGVINDWSVATSNSQTLFFTAWPYQPGTLKVFLETDHGLIAVAFTETDPTTGAFTLATPVIIGTKVVAEYTAAGASVYFGPVAEQATRIDSTHYKVTYAILDGADYRVWVNGYLMNPGFGLDYTRAENIFTFANPIDPSDWVWVDYIANGAP